MNLELQNITCGYHSVPIIKNINIQLSSGEVLCILGANGVGKTTLFKSILGFIKPLEGHILLDGKDIQMLSKNSLAKIIAYVPQSHAPSFPFTVMDVVIVGRTAHLGRFSSPSKYDYSLVNGILEKLEIFSLRNRVYTELSGGERQMVLIARAIAQQPQILMMDEPTSNLDFGNQVRVLEQINKLAIEGLGVIMTSHDPDHAFLCSTKAALLKKGFEYQVGRVGEVITEENLSCAYGVKVKITSIQSESGKEIHSCIPVL
jgi:iron complex transport system ATP-binding protein